MGCVGSGYGRVHWIDQLEKAVWTLPVRPVSALLWVVGPILLDLPGLTVRSRRMQEPFRLSRKPFISSGMSVTLHSRHRVCK